MPIMTNDTGAEPSPLPVEAAWALISEGLHIHRYFLHIDPLLKEFYEKKLSDISIQNHGFKPGVPGAWQTAVINHLTQENSARVSSQLAALTPEEASGALVLTSESTAGDEFRLMPMKSVQLLAEATALIRAAELGFLVDLTVGVVDMRRPSSAPTFQPSAPRTVSMPQGATAFAIAEGLLHAGASQLSHLFALARFENTEQRHEDPAMLLAPFADGLATVGQALGAAFVLRFYEALAPSHSDAAAMLTNRRDSLMAEATGSHAQVLDAVTNINYLPFTDLVETSLPTPQQFRKFQEGAGPGQST